MAKGHQTPLSVIRKNLIKCPENVKKQAYLTLVRPQLEYVDVVHGIRTFKNTIKDIESAQRRAARYVKNEYGTNPGTITKILNDLKWPILGKFLKVYHFHVVLIAIRYAKKRNKYVNHYTSQVFSIHKILISFLREPK